MKRLFTILFISLTFSIFAENTPVKLSLYPNPASSFVEIAFSEIVQSEVTVTMSDILGNKIETFTFKPGEPIRIEFAQYNLKNGMYLLKVETGSEVFLKRLVIKQ